MTQLEVFVTINEAEPDEKKTKQRREFNKILDVHKQNATFIFEEHEDRFSNPDHSGIALYDTEAGIFGNKRKKIATLSSDSVMTAQEIESAILNHDDSIEPGLESKEAAEYCTHCRTDLRDYPNPTYCPECGRRPKPPGEP